MVVALGNVVAQGGKGVCAQQAVGDQQSALVQSNRAHRTHPGMAAAGRDESDGGNALRRPSWSSPARSPSAKT